MDRSPDRLEYCTRVAVLGGTFDPIHLGHLAVAEAVCAAYKPDRLVFVPAWRPPHKDAPLASFEDRYQMTLLAAADHPYFSVSHLEAARPGLSYTIDTIRALRETCPADADIFFVTGSDAALDLPGWKDAEALLRLCHFVVIPRPGADTAALRHYIRDLTAQRHARMDMLAVSTPPVSGTDIRLRVAEGRSVRYMLPRAVEDYLRRHGLYGSAPPAFETCAETLRRVLSPRRYTHTLGVVEEAERLAGVYGADTQKARMAALLHDCVKEYGPDKKRALCALWNVTLDSIQDAQIDLTHGLLGAEAARRDYGVRDEAILQAIRYHIGGHRHMTLLDKIIVLADYIEPTREAYPGLKEMRGLAYTDMDGALLIGLRGTVADNAARGRFIHPCTLDAINELLKGR